MAGLVLLVLLAAGSGGIGWAKASQDESVSGTAGGAPITARHDAGGAVAAGRASGSISDAAHDDTSGAASGSISGVASGSISSVAAGLSAGVGATPGVTIAQADTPEGGGEARPTPQETSESPASPATVPSASSDPVDVELAPSALEEEAESMAEGATAATASPPSAARWVVDRDRSSAGFTLTVEGTPVAGTIGDWRADILLDPDSLQTSSISAVMEMRTASVAGSEISEQQLLGEDGFYTAYFGAANFSADSIRRTADGQYEAAGTLTIKGISRPLTLPFALSIEDGVGHATGSATIDRFDYEMFVAADPKASRIGREVTISIDIVAEAPGG